jgi:peptide-methionine (S)-S-oxide reductase
MALATFAGGCFWCMEHPFDVIDGVASTTSGYTGGQVANPTYEAVSSGRTGHAEAIRVVFDPTKVSYERLVEVFWHNIDPTVKDQQFCDHGTQYRSAIYFHDEAQKKAALDSRARLEAEKRFDTPIQTQLEAAGPFYPAETYHQDFYVKSPDHYQRYRAGCGRDRRLKALWGEAAGH